MSMSPVRAEAPQDDVLDRRWRVKVGNRIYGPYTGHHMLRYICEGRIVPYSTVKPVEGGEWRQASADEGLRLLFTRAKPAKQEPPKAIPRPELKPRSKALVQMLNERGNEDADFVTEARNTLAEDAKAPAETEAAPEVAETPEAKPETIEAAPVEAAPAEAEAVTEVEVETGTDETEIEAAVEEAEEAEAKAEPAEVEVTAEAPPAETETGGAEEAEIVAGETAEVTEVTAEAEEAEASSVEETAEEENLTLDLQAPTEEAIEDGSVAEAETAAIETPADEPADFDIEANADWSTEDTDTSTYAAPAAEDENQDVEEQQAVTDESVPLRLYGHDVGMLPVAREAEPPASGPVTASATSPAAQKLIGDLVDREAIEAMTVHALRHVLHDPLTPQPPHPDGPNGAPVTPLIIIANLLASTREEFVNAVEMLGHADEVKPGIWMLTAPYAPAKVRNHLIQCLGVDDEIYVIDSKSGRIAWFNLAPEGDYSVKPAPMADAAE